MALTSVPGAAGAVGSTPIEYVSATIACNSECILTRNFCGFIGSSQQCAYMAIQAVPLTCMSTTTGYHGPTSNILIAKGAGIRAEMGCGVMTGYLFD